MENNESISTLEAMGFERAQIDLAVKSTGSTNIEVLITFLEQLQNGSENIPQQSGGQAVSQEQQGTSISNLVNQEHVAILMSLGHSKIVSEKSLLMTENKGTEAAIAWIEAHKTDADFEEELLLVQNEKKMSPQEAAEAAKELGRRLREKRRLQEEQDALERERNRIKSGKQMNDVRRDLEEVFKQKKRLDAELAKKQRIQDQKDKEAMLAQLQRDREERFGKKAQSGGQTQQQPVQQKTFTPFELFNTGVKQIKIASPPDLLPDKAKNSLSLIQKILENIIKNPQEPKFRKISLTSQVFQTKIEDTFGARQALDGLGFVEQDGFYQYNGADISLLQQALSVIATELVGL